MRTNLAPTGLGPAYQVPLARRVREGAGLPTMAVGLVTDACQAEAVLAEGSADLVAPGCPMSRSRERIRSSSLADR